MRTFLSLMCAAFFIASGFAGARASDPDVIAAPPTFTVGDTWTFKAYRTLDEARTPGSDHIRVTTGVVREVRDNGDVLIVDPQGNPSALRNRDFNLIERQTDRRVRTYKPFWPLYRYPMRTGDRYDAEVTHDHSTRSGVTIARKATVRVVGWETVTVPAGTFRAIKVETSGEYRTSDNNSNGTFKEAAWLAPVAKMLFVLSSYEEDWGASGGRARNYFALDSFALK